MSKEHNGRAQASSHRPSDLKSALTERGRGGGGGGESGVDINVRDTYRKVACVDVI